MILMISFAPLFAHSFHAGLEESADIAIGTGKGNWDWTDSSRDIQRYTPFTPGIALVTAYDLGPFFQMEGGVGYYWNSNEVANGDSRWVYEQQTLEFPLALRLFFVPRERGFYVKGGTALMVLTGKATFHNRETREDLLLSGRARNRFHGGLQIGLGYQAKLFRGLGEVEAKYITFYTSPDYVRTDGSLGDIRFHRFGVNFRYYF